MFHSRSSNWFQNCHISGITVLTSSTHSVLSFDDRPNCSINLMEPGLVRRPFDSGSKNRFHGRIILDRIWN
ncbi:unnamed protein product [Orchesella dallaii]|uniref:Pectinesterase n=1 Tax=Orchesella dallaii TaxID=48710 RepID=A0ABP1S1B0_9HEXA